MTAKDKAKELILRFRQIPPQSHYTGIDDAEAKLCALICVNEIIKALRSDLPEIGKGKGYWSDVRREIENI